MYARLVTISSQVSSQFLLIKDHELPLRVWDMIISTPIRFIADLPRVIVYLCHRNGDRDDAANIAIVITDGVSNINARRTIPEAESARDIGIHIYSVGIGLTDTRELYGIASAPAEDNTFAVNDFDELVGLEKRIFSQICPGNWSDLYQPMVLLIIQVLLNEV